jgi:hypothetical protein
MGYNTSRITSVSKQNNFPPNLGKTWDPLSKKITATKEELESEKSQTIQRPTCPERSMISVNTRTDFRYYPSQCNANYNLFESNYYAHDSANKKVIDPKFITQREQQKSHPFIVTECLSTHQECTQEYSDITNTFRIRCFCSCHCKGSKHQHQLWWQNHPLSSVGSEVE